MSRRSLRINLDLPIDEMLYEVYVTSVEQDLPCFQTIKVKIVQFEPFENNNLTRVQKYDLADFLAKAISNVGHYATGVTRLVVSFTPVGDRHLIRVQDNGTRFNSPRRWWQFHFKPQLRHAKAIARRLHGTYRHYPASSKGEIVELEWPTPRSFFYNFSRHFS